MLLSPSLLVGSVRVHLSALLGGYTATAGRVVVLSVGGGRALAVVSRQPFPPLVLPPPPRRLLLGSLLGLLGSMHGLDGGKGGALGRRLVLLRKAVRVVALVTLVGRVRVLG